MITFASPIVPATILIATLLVSSFGFAKPIAYADGTTFMHERDRNSLQTELFYAPAYWWSIGLAQSEMQSDDKLRQTEASYAQVNFLLKRWNLPGAQGNIFASFGSGIVNSTKESVVGLAHPGHTIAQRAQYSENGNRFAIQGDYETRQFYSSVKVDVQQTPLFFERTDTGQIGFSPVAHDYDDLAVWFIAQVRKYRGMNDKTEAGAFIRLFKRNIWVEIGMNERRKSQMMLMINY